MIALPTLYDIILNSPLSIDKGLLEVSKVYRFSKFDKLINIFIPSIFIDINKIINSNLALIFKVVISAEVYSQPEYGIGFII